MLSTGSPAAAIALALEVKDVDLLLTDVVMPELDARRRLTRGYARRVPAEVKDDARWLFLTSHALVLVHVSREPEATVRVIAEGVGVTERQAHRVLADLVDAGYVERSRTGRSNSYRVNDKAHLRHPALAEHEVGELLRVLA